MADNGSKDYKIQEIVKLKLDMYRIYMPLSYRDINITI